jgi:putative SOS response-associated peptidase YedK
MRSATVGRTREGSVFAAEWQRRETAKQPFIVRRADGKPFALAGIWERSTTTDGEIIDTCAVITGDAKGAVAGIHDRMPLIVPPIDYARWLDAGEKDLADLLVPTAEALVSYAVSTLVNSPANDDPRCIEPVAVAAERIGDPCLHRP